MEPATEGRVTETIRAVGHENVTGRHGSTFEVTTDDYLTPAGDCILGVHADRAPADFGDEFVSACRDAGATITATFEVAGGEHDHVTTITGHGHPDLSFASDRSLVGRTSDYVDDRTVMLRADGAAGDVPHSLVDALSAGAEFRLTLAVDPPVTERVGGE